MFEFRKTVDPDRHVVSEDMLDSDVVISVPDGDYTIMQLISVIRAFLLACGYPEKFVDDYLGTY